MPTKDSLMKALILLLAVTFAEVVQADETSTTGLGPIVTIPKVGSVEGLYLPDYESLAAFRGIPFAQAPKGDLRWQPPQPHPGWGTETLNATTYGPDCPQPRNNNTDEDCLYLNILTPRGALEDGSKKLPVMVFFHGGGLTLGGQADFAGDRGPLLAASNESMVLVSFSYRLGVLGFLGGSDVMARAEGGSGGNFGLQDQRAALAWVQANIGAFGGDGNQVTIFGQSAGAQSIIHHLVQPDSFPFYQRVILESGTLNKVSEPMALAEDFYEKLLQARGCDNVTCLVAEDADVLVDAGQVARNGSIYFPVIHGVFLTDDAYNLIASKNYNNEVPVITGGNRDEAEITVGPIALNVSANLTLAEFETIATEPGSYLTTAGYVTPEMLPELKHVYDPKVYPYPANKGNHSIPYWMYLRYLSDMIPEKGGCGSLWFARMLAEGGTPSVYTYMFEHPLEIIGGIFAIHSSELLFVFNMEDVMSNDEELELAHSMARYWYSFAISADGVPQGEVSWPKFTIEGNDVLILDVESVGGIRAQKGLGDRDKACDWQNEQARKRGNVPGLDLGRASYQNPVDTDPTDKNPTAEDLPSGAKMGGCFYNCSKSLFVTWLGLMALLL